jgi:hypothetical protein
MSWRSGATAFAMGGIALLVGTLVIERWSWATVVGLAVGGGLLALGYWSGVPRMKEFSRPRVSPRAGGGVAATTIAWSSAAVAVGASLAIAYGARKLGDALDLHLDLGVVAALIGAAATLYAALLLYVAERQ